MMNADEMYQSFEAKVTALTGHCCHVKKADLISAIKKVLEEKGASSVSVFNTPEMQAYGVVDGLKADGVEVHTDHIRKNAETDKVGITEFAYGIAELGTLVQLRAEADDRIASTLVPYHIGIVKKSTLVETIDLMMEKLGAMPKLPTFVGFITGPSRTADIECVGTVGVHGPLETWAIIIDDE